MSFMFYFQLPVNLKWASRPSRPTVSFQNAIYTTKDKIRKFCAPLAIRHIGVLQMNTVGVLQLLNFRRNIFV